MAFVFPAVEKFKTDVLVKHGLTLQENKTKVYHHSGFICNGVAIGCVDFVKHVLARKVNTLVNEVDQVMELLDGDNQSAWVLLSAAISHQFDYALSLQYPSDVLDTAAATLDARFWSELEQVTGPHIPRTEEGLGVECVMGVPNVLEL